MQTNWLPEAEKDHALPNWLVKTMQYFQLQACSMNLPVRIG